MHLSRKWHSGDSVELELDMTPVVVRSNPRVYKNVGMVAVARGPLVYCLEEEDNGKDLHLVRMGSARSFKAEWQPDLLEGVVTLTCDGLRITHEGWDEHTLYAPAQTEKTETAQLRWIPYYAWANRRPGEMRVWIHE